MASSPRIFVPQMQFSEVDKMTQQRRHFPLDNDAPIQGFRPRPRPKLRARCSCGRAGIRWVKAGSCCPYCSISSRERSGFPWYSCKCACATSLFRYGTLKTWAAELGLNRHRPRTPHRRDGLADDQPRQASLHRSDRHEHGPHTRGLSTHVSVRPRARAARCEKRTHNKRRTPRCADVGWHRLAAWRQPFVRQLGRRGRASISTTP
jgi:hypothetical protein